MPRKVSLVVLINEKAPNNQTIYLYQQIILSKECTYRYLVIFDLYFTAQEKCLQTCTFVHVHYVRALK